MRVSGGAGRDCVHRPGTEGSKTNPAAGCGHNGSFVLRGGKEQLGAEDAVGSAARWQAGTPRRPARHTAAASAEWRRERGKKPKPNQTSSLEVNHQENVQKEALFGKPRRCFT